MIIGILLGIALSVIFIRLQYQFVYYYTSSDYGKAGVVMLLRFLLLGIAFLLLYLWGRTYIVPTGIAFIVITIVFHTGNMIYTAYRRPKETHDEKE